MKGGKLLGFCCHLPKDSDIPEISFQEIEHEHFPSEMIWNILVRCDPKTAARCKCLNSEWNQKISSSKFIRENFLNNKEKTECLALQLAIQPWIAIVDWITLLEAKTGNELPCQIPIEFQHFGWWSFIGSEDGIMALRYSHDGFESDILAWNPFTGQSRQIHDSYHRGFILDMDHYGFAYEPNSLNYYVLHVFKRFYRGDILNYRLWNSVDADWEVGAIYDSRIEKLGPNTVMHGGSAFWINWVGPDFQYSRSVVKLSLKNKKIDKFRIPPEVRNEFQYLATFDKDICYISFSSGISGLKIMVWKLDTNAGSMGMWSKLFRIVGFGIADNPCIFFW